MGIVDGLDAKLPRTVLFNSVEELPQKVVDILQDARISLEDVSSAIATKVQ